MIGMKMKSVPKVSTAAHSSAQSTPTAGYPQANVFIGPKVIKIGPQVLTPDWRESHQQLILVSPRGDEKSTGLALEPLLLRHRVRRC